MTGPENFATTCVENEHRGISGQVDPKIPHDEVLRQPGAKLPCPRFGLSAITTFVDGTYEPAEVGRKAIILAIEDDVGEPYDCVAFFAKQPGRWWMRCGNAVALGLDAIEEAYVTDQAVRIVEDPAAWIAARGGAVCVLDWAADVYGLLALAPRIVCDTPTLAGKVRRAISRPRLDIRVRRAA